MGDEVKAIIFDVGGVLQLGPKTRFTRKDVHVSGVHEIIAKKLKISLDQYLDSIDSFYAKSIEGQTFKKELISTIAAKLNYSSEKLEKLYFKTYKKKYHKNIKLFNIAKQLKKRGYKIAILSDQWHLSQEALISKKDQKIFDNVILSCEVGMRKPNIEIYNLILKKLKIKPSESIFVDNQSWNLIPANKLGMKTILFTDNKKIKKQLLAFGVHL